MSLGPGYAGNDQLAPAANLDIGSASGWESRLDAEAVEGHVENADVLPGSIDAHSGPDHHLLAILAWLQRKPACIARRCPAAASRVGVDKEHPAHHRLKYSSALERIRPI